MEKAVITCGGTGGHFYPGLSIARQLQAEGASVRLLLSGVHSARQREVARSFGIEADTLPVMPSPGRSPVRWMRFLRGLIGGYFRARREMLRCRPDFVIGMGSFASLPVVFAAFRLRVPVFLHDGNARIGRANRLLSRFARFTAAGFPPVNPQAVHSEIIRTGMPVRPELEERRGISSAEAIAGLRDAFGADLSPDRFTLLVFGGSQGAAAFNSVLPRALSKLAGKFDFQLLHLTGKGKLEATLALYAECDFPRVVVESDERMELFLGAADLVCGRSGGSTVAELALFGKPAILVPYPFAAEGHQADNARFYAGTGAALMVTNADFTVERAEKLLAGFFADPGRLDAMRTGAATAAEPHAARRLLERIRMELAREA